jgi:hypothetical protein
VPGKGGFGGMPPRGSRTPIQEPGLQILSARSPVQDCILSMQRYEEKGIPPNINTYLSSPHHLLPPVISKTLDTKQLRETGVSKKGTPYILKSLLSNYLLITRLLD